VQMTAGPKGAAVEVSWIHPMAGSYVLQMSATDADGRITQTSIPLTVSAP
jgi:hypothetical protein